MEKVTCKDGLKRNTIKKIIFDREVLLCRQLAKEKKGKCGWGKCKDCGVVPLLWKLYKGELFIDKKELAATRKKLLKLR
jgi:hypothetical protein